MRRSAYTSNPLPETLNVRNTLKTLFPYIWTYRIRVLLALACLVAAKLTGVLTPILFKQIVDHLTTSGVPSSTLLFPAALLLAYGGMRLSGSLMTELRELLFSRVTLRAIRHIGLSVFQHLHALSLRFHLNRQTGGLSRDIERGTRAISSLISYTLYSILPTLLEITLVLAILLVQYDVSFALITVGSLAAYVVFTIQVSGRRIAIRRRVNEADSAANTLAVDSLLNFETVKYFNNEAFEATRYDKHLAQWEEASIHSQTSLAVLNLGQQAIIALGVTAMMWRAAQGVTDGSMTVGDLVLVNAFLIQLYLPMNFLGVIYREIRQSLADIERLFALLQENSEVRDAPQSDLAAAVAQPERPATAPEIRFEGVSFAYDPARPILKDLTFILPAGKTTAVVGPSGAGKSTLGRLLFRFYDVQSGKITVNGQDIREIAQARLRQQIGVVPQDTVLFNNTLRYNIAYGEPEAPQTAVESVAKAAHLDDFIARLPKGYETKVGERGLKLSGGEKQRVAIARTLLKDPPILIFDEATSSLDSATEQGIQAQIEKAAEGRTTLIIAHRLSTIASADNILVISEGSLLEEGTHAELLQLNGMYARMWAIQQQE